MLGTTSNAPVAPGATGISPLSRNKSKPVDIPAGPIGPVGPVGPASPPFPVEYIDIPVSVGANVLRGLAKPKPITKYSSNDKYG